MNYSLYKPNKPNEMDFLLDYENTIIDKTVYSNINILLETNPEIKINNNIIVYL